MTTAPELATIFEDNATYRFVYIGTGRYLGDGDVTSTATQTMYGLIDDLSATPLIDPLRAKLKKQTLSVMADPKYRSASDEKFDLSGATKKRGWYVDLPAAGERISTDPQLAFGALVFTSNIPSLMELRSRRLIVFQHPRLSNRRAARRDVVVFDFPRQGAGQPARAHAARKRRGDCRDQDVRRDHAHRVRPCAVGSACRSPRVVARASRFVKMRGDDEKDTGWLGLLCFGKPLGGTRRFSDRTPRRCINHRDSGCIGVCAIRNGGQDRRQERRAGARRGASFYLFARRRF